MVHNNEYILEAIGIKKHFGGVYALDNVDLHLKHNEILGLVGDNGAGKSTLIKIISGILKKDEGEIYFDGKKVNINNPKNARTLGIETVYQNLNLVDIKNIPFNIFLGRELTYDRFPFLKSIGFVNEKKMLKESKNLMNRFRTDIIDFNKSLIEYSGGQRQAVAISKAVYWGSRVVILDEPTAALGVNESRKALELIKMLKEKSNVSIIVISHNLQHLFSVIDRIMILRRGKLVTVQNVHEVTANDIVEYITGAGKVIEEV